MKSFLLSCSFAFAGLLALPALAADAAAAPAAGDGPFAACRPDIEKLCPGIEPGGGRLKTCFKEHRKELSPACKKSLMAARKSGKGARAGAGSN